MRGACAAGNRLERPSAVARGGGRGSSFDPTRSRLRLATRDIGNTVSKVSLSFSGTGVHGATVAAAKSSHSYAQPASAPAALSLLRSFLPLDHLISHVDLLIKCRRLTSRPPAVASRVFCLLAMAAARLPLAAVAVAAQLVLGVGGGWWGSSDSSADSSAEPQHQVAWEELRRELEATAAAPMDESVLPLFDRAAGLARMEHWRRELGLPDPQRSRADSSRPAGAAAFLDEDLDGTGWDYWESAEAAGWDHADGGEERPSREFSKGATDRRSMETIALYQRLQAQAIAERMWSNKPAATLLSATEISGGSSSIASAAPSIWPIACNEGLTAEMYRSAYGVIAGCSPQSGECERRVVDGFATPTECAQLIAATDIAMQ